MVMIFLSPLSGDLPSVTQDCREEVPVPAPSWFRPPIGRVRRVHVNGLDEYVRAVGNTPAKEAGLRYESSVQQALSQILSDYIPSPKCTFVDDGPPRVAIPDGIYTPKHEDLFVIFEIKYSHIPDAWWQLERKYKPILQVWRPKSHILCVEIVRTFDSAVPFPCQFEFIPSLEGLLSYISGAAKQTFGVFQWRP